MSSVPRLVSALCSLLVGAVSSLLVVGVGPALADSCPNAQFRVGSSANLPDCRAYELVSPADKNGADILAVPVIQSAPSDDAVVFPSLGGFADARSAGLVSYYRATRAGGGWSTESISPPMPVDFAGNINLNDSFPHVLSSDLSTALWQAWPDPPAVPGAQLAAYSQYRQANVPDGSYEQLVTNWPGGTSDFALGAADAAIEHVGFESGQNLTPEASGSSTKAYEWSAGQVSLVGEVPPPGASSCGAGGPACVPASLSLIGGGAGPGGLTRNTVSADGTRIVFNAFNKVYVRENGNVTVEASGSQRTDCDGDPTCGGDGHPDPQTDPAGTQDKTFAGANAQVSRVLFTTTEQLTDADTNSAEDLYEYDVDTGHLRLISTDSDPSDGMTGLNQVGGGVFGNTIGESSDGSTVYFAAPGRLVAGQPQAPGNNIYVWHDDGSPSGVLRYVATVAPATAASQGDTENWDGQVVFRFVNSEVSPNGRFLVVTARAKVGAYDNAGHAELYRYDYQTGRVDCVSCRPDGQPATGDAALRTAFGQPIAGTINLNAYQPRNVLDDGRVFFDTSDAIIPSDTNAKRDVYEWNDGKVSLISSGQSDSDSYFSDASPQGTDVYFLTREQLVGADGDDSLDLYDARVDGGLASQNQSSAPPCIGGVCQGSPMPPPTDPSAPSASFFGPGDLSASTTAARVRVLSRTVRGTSFLVGVRVPGKGRIAITAGGITPVRRSISRAGTYRLRVTLTPREKRLLVRRHTLKLTLRIRYAPAGVSASIATVSLTVKRAARHQAKRGARETNSTTRRAGR